MVVEGVGVKEPAVALICSSCGQVGNNEDYVYRGDFGLEILLWLMGIIPGVLYSLWRRSDPKASPNVCPACGGRLIPRNSPVGRSMIAAMAASATQQSVPEATPAPEPPRAAPVAHVDTSGIDFSKIGRPKS